MAMIRQANARVMARDAIVLDLGDLTRQAEQIRARARAEAELILAQARAEREQILAGAAEEGRKVGLARGMEEGERQGRERGREAAMIECREQLSRIDVAWSEALRQFTEQRERMLADMRQDVLRLAVQMGEMVTKRALGARPDAAVDQMAAVLALLVRPTRLIVAVHPDDQSIVHDALPSLKERFSAATHVELIKDPSLDRGSCVAHTCSTTSGDGSGGLNGGGGKIDASISTQLERIVEALLPEVRRDLPAAPELQQPWDGDATRNDVVRDGGESP